MMPFILYRKLTAINEKGFVLFELLIAMTLLAGSITVLHSIYANLIAKQIELQRVHDQHIERRNQYEITTARQHGIHLGHDRKIEPHFQSGQHHTLYSSKSKQTK